MREGAASVSVSPHVDPISTREALYRFTACMTLYERLAIAPYRPHWRHVHAVRSPVNSCCEKTPPHWHWRLIRTVHIWPTACKPPAASSQQTNAAHALLAVHTSTCRDSFGCAVSCVHLHRLRRRFDARNSLADGFLVPAAADRLPLDVVVRIRLSERLQFRPCHTQPTRRLQPAVGVS